MYVRSICIVGYHITLCAYSFYRSAEMRLSRSIKADQIRGSNNNSPINNYHNHNFRIKEMNTNNTTEAKVDKRR